MTALISKRRVGVAVASSLLLASACATTSEDLGISPTVAQACLVGVGAGALLGALVDDENRGRNALIGAAAGAAIGCTAGSVLNQRRLQYANSADFYAAQIDLTRQTNMELAQINASTQAEIASNRAEIERLAALESLAEADRASARAQLASLESTQNLTTRRIEVIEREIGVQEAALEQTDAPQPGDPTYQELVSEIAEMRGYVEDLRSYADTLASQQDAIAQFI